MSVQPSPPASRTPTDLAGHPLPIQAAVLRAAVGEGRILYGSDYCWTPEFAVGKQVAALEADPDVDWRTVTANNVRQFLPHAAASPQARQR